MFPALSPSYGSQALIHNRLNQSIIAVTAFIDHIHLVTAGIAEHVEIVSDEFHLLGGVFGSIGLMAKRLARIMTGVSTAGAPVASVSPGLTSPGFKPCNDSRVRVMNRSL